MIDQKTLSQLPEMARCLHFAMNNFRVQDSDWVQNFVKDFPTSDLQMWDTTVPVLSACFFLKIWFKDHMPNHYLYTGGFTDADMLSTSTREFIKDTIQEKVRDLIKAGDTIPDYAPFQTNISDTILALHWARGLIEAMESGHFVNWHTLEVKTEIEF